MQAGGHRFDPDRLHHFCNRSFGDAEPSMCSLDFPDDEDTLSAGFPAVRWNCFRRFFDIVNGFLIDAVAHDCLFKDRSSLRHLHMLCIWLRLFVRIYNSAVLMQGCC